MSPRLRPALALALLLASAAARAQLPPDVAATRDALVEQAFQLAQSGEHARALALAERAGELAWTPSLRGFVAQEQEALGRLALALGSAQLCLQGAERDAAMPHREEYLQGCRAMVERLRPRVARLTVRTPQAEPAGLHITLDGQELARALWNIPYLLTAGSVRVAARAEGGLAYEGSVRLREGESATVELRLTAPCPAGTRRSAQGSCEPEPRSLPPAQPSLAPLLVGALSAGVGAALLGAAVGLNVAEENALAAFRDPARYCWVPPGGSPQGPANCPADYRSLVELRGASISAYALGGALGAAGAAVLVLRAAQARSGTRARVGCAPSLEGAGLRCAGTF